MFWQLWQCHCRKCKKKYIYIVLAIVAMKLPKNVKKKKCFGNCGNAIAENVKKKKCFGNCGNAIAENGKKIMKSVKE